MPLEDKLNQRGKNLPAGHTIIGHALAQRKNMIL